MKAKTVSTYIVGTILLVFWIGSLPIAAAPPVGNTIQFETQGSGGSRDDRPDPLSNAQREFRKKALRSMLDGKAYGRIHQVARGQFVELERQNEDPVWTVLGEFNDLKHNSIPEPDRNVFNTTIWRAGYDELLLGYAFR